MQVWANFGVDRLQLLDAVLFAVQNVPGWVVGQDVNFMTKSDRPPVNHVDPRRISQW